MRNLIILGIILLCYWFYKKLISPGKPIKDHPDANGTPFTQDQPKEREMVKDPVCQVYLPKDQAVCHHANGRAYYFCSNHCADKFASKES